MINYLCYWWGLRQISRVKFQVTFVSEAGTGRNIYIKGALAHLLQSKQGDRI